MTTSRREFLQRLSCGVMPAMLVSAPRQDSAARGGSQRGANSGTAADTLPYQFGAGRTAVGPLDNDPGVVAIERKLRCTCGCTLDVYTCRTTDFSCTYSPAMHRDVVAQVQGGATAEQILQAFVAKDGQAVLMAPAPRGFNLMGYVVPGLTVIAVGGALVAWLLRSRPVAAAAGGASQAVAGPDAEQLAELRRALDDVES